MSAIPGFAVEDLNPSFREYPLGILSLYYLSHYYCSFATLALVACSTEKKNKESVWSRHTDWIVFDYHVKT